MFNFDTQTLIGYLYAIPGVLFALSVHEFSHGWVANKLGDPTAKISGRLTLNPMKHIDPLGLIAMFLVHVGWANPVPINTRYFKNAKRDTAFVALAGPMSNLISAFIGTFIYWALIIVLSLNPGLSAMPIWNGIIIIFVNFVYLNVGLAIFNLIPIPPLDGSRILDAFLPANLYLAYHKYEQIVRIVLLVVLIFDIISIAPAVDFISDAMYNVSFFVCDKIYSLFV